MKQLKHGEGQDLMINLPRQLNNPSTTAKKHHLITNSTFQSDSFMSMTENQIFSHQIIKNVMAQHHNMTVNHQIHQIPTETVLNAEPKKIITQQFNFKTIPPNNKFYQSVFSTKSKIFIDEVRRITQKLSLTKGQKQHKSQVKITPELNNLSNKRNKISVSGLVTYNFRSINASRSVGYNIINHEQKLQQNKKAVERSSKCKSMQHDRILQKGPAKRYQRIKQNQQLILSNKNLSTEHYLKKLIRQKKENQLIYNQKAKNLNYIKQMMGQMNNNYEDSQLIVNKIETAYKTKQNIYKNTSIKTEVDEQSQLMHRKIPHRKKKVFIRYVTFID